MSAGTITSVYGFSTNALMRVEVSADRQVLVYPVRHPATILSRFHAKLCCAVDAVTVSDNAKWVIMVAGGILVPYLYIYRYGCLVHVEKLHLPHPTLRLETVGRHKKCQPRLYITWPHSRLYTELRPRPDGKWAVPDA